MLHLKKGLMTFQFKLSLGGCMKNKALFRIVLFITCFGSYSSNVQSFEREVSAFETRFWHNSPGASDSSLARRMSEQMDRLERRIKNIHQEFDQMSRMMEKRFGKSSQKRVASSQENVSVSAKWLEEKGKKISYQLLVKLPGFDKKNLSINLRDQEERGKSKKYVIVSGKKQFDKKYHESSEQTAFFFEQVNGRQQRFEYKIKQENGSVEVIIPLPDNVEMGRDLGTFERDVLTIAFPKVGEKKRVKDTPIRIK